MSTTKTQRVQSEIVDRHEIIKIVEREWRKELTMAQHAVVSFIVDRTLRWNKRWERVTVRQMIEGITSRAGAVIHAGIGLGRATIFRAIKVLLDKGYIVRKEILIRGTVEYQYAVTAGGAHMSSLPTPRKTRTRPASSVPTPRSGGSQDETGGVSQRDRGGISVRPLNNGHSNDKPPTTELRGNRASQREGGIAQAISGARAKAKSALSRKARKPGLNSSRLEAAWRAAMGDNWETVRLIPFSPKERGSAGNLIKYLGDDVIPFVEWCVANWHLVRKSKFPDTGKVQFPENPDFGFLFAFRKAFLAVWNDRLFYERIANHPKAGLIVHMRRKGYTVEQAIEAAEEAEERQERKDKLDEREDELARRERALDLSRKSPMNRGAADGKTGRQALDEMLERHRARRGKDAISIKDVTPWE
jgi:hypothetical protein